jgi:hypothetical protein
MNINKELASKLGKKHQVFKESVLYHNWKY